MVGNIVWVVAWSLNPATPNHARSWRRISGTSSVPTSMGSTLTSTGCPRTCAGFPNTAAVSGRGGGMRIAASGWCRSDNMLLVFLPPIRSPDEGSVQVVLPSGRKYGVLPAAGSRHRWDALWPRHEWHLRAGPLPGKCFPFSLTRAVALFHGGMVLLHLALAGHCCALFARGCRSIRRLCQPPDLHNSRAWKMSVCLSFVTEGCGGLSLHPHDVSFSQTLEDSTFPFTIIRHTFLCGNNQCKKFSLVKALPGANGSSDSHVVKKPFVWRWRGMATL